MAKTSLKKTPAAAPAEAPAVEVQVSPVVVNTSEVNATEEQAVPAVLPDVNEEALLVDNSTSVPTFGAVKGYLANTTYVAPFLRLVATNSALAGDDPTLIGKFYLDGMNLSDRIKGIVLALSSYFEENVTMNAYKTLGRPAKVWDTQQQANAEGYISSAGQNINDEKLKLYNNVAMLLLAVEVTNIPGAEVAPIVIKDVKGVERRYMIAKFKVTRTSVTPLTTGILNTYNTLLKRDFFKGNFEVQVLRKKRDNFSWYVPSSRFVGITDPNVYNELRSMFMGIESADLRKE